MKPVATVAFFLAVCLVLGAAEIDFSNPSSVTAAFKCAYPHFHLSRYRLVAGDRVALNMDEILNWITVPRSKLRTACCKLDNTLCDKTKKAGPAERADCESENGIACNVDMDAAAHGRNEMSGAIIAGVVLSALSLAGMLGGAGYAGYLHLKKTYSEKYETLDDNNELQDVNAGDQPPQQQQQLQQQQQQQQNE